MVFLALAGFWTVVYSFSTYVRPYEVAIKMSRYGGGLEKDPYYGPALYFTGPGVTYHRFPIVVQSLNLTSSATESTFGTEYDRSIRALEVDSLDGSKIKIDATILYRINDAYAVMTRIGPGRIFEDNAIIPKSAEALKESLGKLKAEDFYNEKLRIQATEEARVNLNNRVKEFGMAVDHVLIRQYYYLPEYQAQIEARKVQDQLVNTNQSMAEAAKTEALRGKLDAEGQALVNVESQRAASEVTKIKAEADLYSRKRRSEGDLLVSLAEARGKELENNAYRASAGSENLVGLEMAEALDGIEVIFLQSGKNGVNPIDLNQTLNLFDVKGN
jgi:regulator of protease activity HflC (stomatin/prohibitin superfamily)